MHLYPEVASYGNCKQKVADGDDMGFAVMMTGEIRPVDQDACDGTDIADSYLHRDGHRPFRLPRDIFTGPT